MVATLVRLRWRLTVNAVTRSPWMIIAAVLGGLYGAAFLAGLVSGAATLGGRASLEVIAPVLAATGALTVLGWTLLPLLLTGLDSTLDPRAMAAWTAPSRRLARALAVGAGAGLPGILTGLGMLLPLLTWGLAGQPGPALLAVLMAPAALATCVLLSRVLVVGAGLSGSRRGRDGVAVIGTVLVLAVAMVPGILSSAAGSGGLDGARLAAAGRVAGLTPFGWALAAPGYLALGRPVAAALLALGALALPAVLLPVWERVVARVMTGPARATGGARAYAAPSADDAAAGRGSAVERAVLPWHRRLSRLLPSPAAAVAARCLRYWRTDPRYLTQALSLVAVALVIAVSTATGYASSEVTDADASVSVGLGGGPGGVGGVVLVAVPLIALVAGWVLHDDLGMDSTALWTHVSAGLRGRDDRLGRVAAALVWQVPLVLVVGLVGAAWSGSWYALPAVLGLTAALLGAGTAWSSVMSVLMPYETNPPGESPLRSRSSGGVFVAAFLQMIGLLAVVVAAGPALAGLIVIALAGSWSWGWALLVGGLVWGAALGALGVVQGGRLLDARGVRVLATIRTWPGHEDAP